MNSYEYDGNYNETSEPTTSVFFPDMSEFEEQEKIETDEENINEQISEWALKKIGTLQVRLEAMQNAKDAKKFPGSHNYRGFSSHVLFNLANETFGYDGWSSAILSSSLVHEDLDEENHEYSVKFQVVVRIILKDGTYNDEVGIGEAAKLPHKNMCYNKGKKQAITDGLKNAILGLRNLLFEHELKQTVWPKVESTE